MLKVLYLDNQEDLEIYNKIIEENSSFYSAYNREQYFDVFCGGLHNLICFVYEKENGMIILPGYLKPVVIYDDEKQYCDFQTPYGYTGPFFSENLDQKEVEQFWIVVKEWLFDKNVVSEFIRFNLFDNHLGFNGLVHNTMLNIKGEIINEEDQWSNFDHKVRKNVKKAQRENLISKIYYKNIDDDVLQDFHTIYIETMKRTSAADFFLYSLDLFKKFIYKNLNLCAICTIYDEGKAISSELLLISDHSLFSFLGGTKEDYFNKRPNDFLKFEVINWARSNSFKYYVLGGGYGYEDGIFKYKKSFFPDNVIEYKTGRLMINEEVYQNLVLEVNNQRFKNALPELNLKDESFFPLYNKQN